MESNVERGEEGEDSVSELLRDRFRLCAISIAEAEAKQNGMEISPLIVACVSDLALKYARQMAKDVEVFARHAGRKSVNMEDVILCAHRNDNLTSMLRSFSNNLKAKEPLSEKQKKRKKIPQSDDKTAADLIQVADP